ncbi:MAG: hypothetical protein KF837_44530, partial [Labilithrix sp.]|nr:hypothetical protein [Labilithrix sp.]
PPVLPHPGGTGDLVPWGGTDASRWRPEATLANATSDALNRAWAMPGVTDAVVAVPASMVSSQFSEFGDGQLNALATLGGWQRKDRPPVVATLVSFENAPKKAIIRFDRSMALAATSFEVVYYANGRKTVDLPIVRTADGDFEAEWIVAAEVGFESLTSNAAVVVHPKGWNDWFPLWFRMPVRKISELRAKNVSFSDGRNVFDREGISVQNETNPTQTPYERLATHRFSGRYNGQGTQPSPYNPQDIHARFPASGGMLTTGVGQGWTWVADERPNAFKVMYTCFEARQPELSRRSTASRPAAAGTTSATPRRRSSTTSRPGRSWSARR